MGVAKGVHKVAGRQATNLGHHQGEQRIGGDVEGHPEKEVGAALVKLAGKPPIGHVELKQGMAGRQGHAVHFRHVPSADDVPTGVGIVLDAPHHLADLIDGAAPGRGP